jgi:HK97 family phage major capsid protein
VEVKELYEKLNTGWSQMQTHMDQQQEELKKFGEKDAQREQTITTWSTKIQELEDELKRVRAERDRPPLDVVGARDRSYSTTAADRLEGDAKRRYDLYWRGVRGGVLSLDEQERREFKERFLVRRGSDLDERQFANTGLTLQDREGKALSLGDETAGGYLAPPEFIQDILKGVQLISPVRPLAQTRQTSRRSVQYPVRSGVFAAKWTAETGTRTETAGLSYALEEIPNHEMYADVLVSDQDLEDAVFNLEQEILDNCTEQFAKAEGAAFVNGSGVGQPEGLLTNASVVPDNQTANATGGVTSTGLLTIWGNLKTVYAKNATWLMNRQTIVGCRSLADSQGRYLWEPGLADGTPPNLLGSPYIEVPDMPNTPGATGTAYPILYGNVKRAYLIVDRINVVVRRLQEKYAESGQIAYLVRKRVGGQVVIPEAIRKLGAVHS